MRGCEGGKAGFIVHAVAVAFVVIAGYASDAHAGAVPLSRAFSDAAMRWPDVGGGVREMPR
jgi:hypothetical protein